MSPFMVLNLNFRWHLCKKYSSFCCLLHSWRFNFHVVLFSFFLKGLHSSSCEIQNYTNFSRIMFLLNLFLSFHLVIISVLNPLVLKTLLLNVIILVLIEARVFKTVNFFSNSPYVSPSKISNSSLKALLKRSLSNFL